MIDDPLVFGLDSKTLEAARKRASVVVERLIYIHAEGRHTTSLAEALRKLGGYFEISKLRMLDDGVGVVGRARAAPIDKVVEQQIAELLECAVGEGREVQQQALQQLREVERGLRRRALEMLEVDRRNTDATADREALDHKFRLAQLQADKVRSTLSFRLGHILIHNTKSFGKALQLPRALWELQQDASGRREQRGSDTPLRRIVRKLTRKESSSEVAPPRPPPAPARRFKVPFALETGADLSRLRIAGIFDEFTVHGLAPECELVPLHAATWQAQLAKHPPHLLFVESAWHGAGGSWDRKLGQLAPEVRALVQHCRAAGIPTAFWNKEDPVHFGTFLNTAALFDTVFTTDFDCIHRYRDLLGHDRVYLLPFACQPRQHNPIETFERKAAASFAGAYYARYPERQRDFLRILIGLLDRGPVEIFDRNYGKTDADYQFPASYRDYIVGSLPISEIERAYKGYRYAININSIKSSQTMFARRVFELLASNTLTVSNYAKGIRVLFGDLVIVGDDTTDLATRLAAVEADGGRALRRAALRKVLAEHTYQDRLSYIVTKLFEDVAPPRLLPTIAVIGAPAIADAFARQRYPHKRLVTVTAETAHRPAVELVAPGEFVAPFAEGDYGEHYLEDLALATRYYGGPVIGRASDGVVRTGQTVPRTAAIIRRDRLGTVTLGELVNPATIDDALALDLVDDPTAINTGVSLAAVLGHAEKIEVAAVDRSERALGPVDFARMFETGRHDAVFISHAADGMVIDSQLDGDRRQQIFQSGQLPVSELGFDIARFQLEVTAGLRIEIAFQFTDHTRKRIGEASRSASMPHELELPTGTAYVRLGVVAIGAGTAVVRRLVLGKITSNDPTRIVGRSQILLVTNGYPAAGMLYRNGFVHRRVLDYRRAGVDVDVFCLRPHEPLTYHEFEGIDVVSGRGEILRRMLASNYYETVLVHFLDDEIWRQLRTRLDEFRVFVWIHGAEIHPWHRRSYNYTTPEELASAKSSSKSRTELWNGVLRPLHPNVHVITVSRTFATEIEQDYEVALPAAQHTVIHNVIDTALFRYEPKPTSQRTKILSIRPFASRQYGNDLSVQAILTLSTRSWFGELDFYILGDGQLFDETVAPLRKLRNVLIERRFARQDEIAELHRTHGVFLCPTRWDSQGVSRDEAMSSGLVPVTTRIAAVPEFVDEGCGFLAPPDDALALAAAIETLYLDPLRFQRMSERAAARVRRDRASEQTTTRELALFRGSR